MAICELIPQKGAVMGTSKEPCMLCGKETGAFIGLCDPCCRTIKAKNDAFAQRSKERLEQWKALDVDGSKIHEGGAL